MKIDYVGTPLFHIASKHGGKYVLCSYGGENAVYFPEPVMRRTVDLQDDKSPMLEDLMLKTWDDIAKLPIMEYAQFKSFCRRLDRRIDQLL